MDALAGWTHSIHHSLTPESRQFSAIASVPMSLYDKANAKSASAGCSLRGIRNIALGAAWHSDVRKSISRFAGRSTPARRDVRTQSSPNREEIQPLTAFVTGAAGFVGSNLTDRLLALGHDVVGFDNFSTGRSEFLARALENRRFRLHRADLLDREALSAAMAGADFVYHLASNADVRFGTHHPRKDLEQNTIGTWNVLEAMRANNVRRIAFSSTGSVYGEPEVFPTPEECPFPVQTSLYGASKLAAEGLIEAYSEGFDMQAWIFRFVSLLGPRYSHGHIIDFYRQLREHPDVLNVLGDGHQRKSYLYVDVIASKQFAHGYSACLGKGEHL